MEAIKINSLELENVKRVKAVKLEPTANGLTVIGGKNNQGKTSVLDAIAWALGGDRYKPSKPEREGSMVPPDLHITLSNGIKVDRTGKNGSLKVSDPEGKKAGQKLLDSFVSEFALDLPKFMEQSNKEKADTLLQIIGVGDQLHKLDNEIQSTYNRRVEIGRIRDDKRSHAKEMVQWDGVPEEIISASELIKQQQEILARNGENQHKRENLARYTRIYEDAERAYAKAKEELSQATVDLATARTSAKNLQDESTAELEESISKIDETNAKIRDNLTKARAEEEAEEYGKQYNDLSSEIDKARETRMNLLKGKELPLPDLSVNETGSLTYKGQEWDNMSSSEQLKVATAIVKALNPKCGFVLMDKLEQMDVDTMNEFGKWLTDQNLQAIATRVSTGEECSIIIEDGYSLKDGQRTADTETKPATVWKEGQF